MCSRLTNGALSRRTGHAAARERRALVSAMSAAAAKLVNVATLLISVPMTLHYLGPERYGLWMAMSSAVYVLSFADLGIGNALINYVANAYGRDDRPSIREAVSTTAIIFGALSVILLAVFSAIDATILHRCG